MWFNIALFFALNFLMNADFCFISVWCIEFLAFVLIVVLISIFTPEK